MIKPRNHTAVWACVGLAAPAALPTCFHLAIQRSGTVQDEALDLQKLVRFVPSDDREAKATAAFPQLRVNELAFQFRRVSCKKGFAWIKRRKVKECQEE